MSKCYVTSVRVSGGAVWIPVHENSPFYGRETNLRVPSTKSAIFMDGNEKRGWLKVYDHSASLGDILSGMTYWRM